MESFRFEVLKILHNFHAVYGELNGVFLLDTLVMFEGDLPPRCVKLIIEWATRYQSELNKMWNTKEFIKLPGLE